MKDQKRGAIAVLLIVLANTLIFIVGGSNASLAAKQLNTVAGTLLILAAMAILISVNRRKYQDSPKKMKTFLLLMITGGVFIVFNAVIQFI
jgi:hypothetical protein